MTNQLPSTQTATDTAGRSLTRPTSLSLEQKAVWARRLISALPITQNQAAKDAKKLCGKFANLRADNPAEFIQAVADVLEQYPAGIVNECLDPNRGIASKIEFLSIKSLGEWLKARLEWYEAVAAYRRPPDPRQEAPSGAIASRALDKLWVWLRTPRADRGAPPTWREAAQEVAGEKQT